MAAVKPSGKEETNLATWWANAYPVKRLSQWTQLMGNLNIEQNVLDEITSGDEIILVLIQTLNADFIRD
eukprot:1425669-Karenia_brevis.AAC.1